MIEKLASITGVWDEDTVRIIEKVNEIVDMLNDMGSERAKIKTERPKKGTDKGKVDDGMDVDAFAVG